MNQQEARANQRADSAQFLNTWLHIHPSMYQIDKVWSWIEAVIVTLCCASWARSEKAVLWICREVTCTTAYNQHASTSKSIKHVMYCGGSRARYHVPRGGADLRTVANTLEGRHGGVRKCRMGVTSKLDSGMGGTSHLHLSSASSQLRGRYRPWHIFTHFSMSQPETAIPPGGLPQTLQHLGSIRNTSADEGVPLSSAWRIRKGLQPSPVFRLCSLGLFFPHEWHGCV